VESRRRFQLRKIEASLLGVNEIGVGKKRHQKRKQ
jgi:hypothetical protein